MPPGPWDAHTGPHNRRHMAFRFWAVVLDADGRSLAENGSAKICHLVSDFPNRLGVLGLP